MSGGKGNITPKDGKQFSSEYQPEEKWTEKKAIKVGKDLILWLNEIDADDNDKGNIFFEEFLVIKNGYHQCTISYLTNKFTSFSNLIDIARKIQEIKLIKYGCADRLNSSMTKFVLQNCHDWREKRDIDAKITKIDGITFDEK